MSMQPSPAQMRAPRVHSAERAAQERWLIIGLAVMVLAPVAFVFWALGLVVLRFARVQRKWLLLVAGVLVLFHLARRGFIWPAIAQEHFTLYREVLPKWMAEAGKPEPRPFRNLGVGFLMSGAVGFMWLSAPVGLVLACVSTLARKPVAPEWSQAAQDAKAAERRTGLGTAQQRALAPPDPVMEPAAIGSVTGGDLAWSVKHKSSRGLWLQFPTGTLNLPRVLVGQPGFGKTHAFLRIVYTYARLGYQVVFVDGKGTDPSLPGQVLEAFYQGSTLGQAGTRALVYPDEPATMWRGTPRDVVQKVLSVWTFAEQHQFFEAVAENGLHLAIDVPGAPPVESSDELLRRLDPKELERIHKHYGTAESRATFDQINKIGKDYGLASFALRLRTLLRAVGPTLDGDRGFEDTDVAVLTVPSGLKRRDASAIMRVLLEEFGMYASGRKGNRPCLLIFDEFSALQGGRATATDLVERLRSTDTEVMLGVQSFEGLGGGGPYATTEARRILNACSGGLMLFRTPSPDDFVRMAGSVIQPDVSHGLDAHGLSDRGQVRSTGKFRVDPDAVRQLVTGECFYIVGGTAAQLYVATTQIEPWAGDQADLAIRDAVWRGVQHANRRQEGTDDD